MQENNNTNNTNNTSSLEGVTGIKQGSNEFGSMRDIHQRYNQLSGFESMLHIIKKYRYVLYPFILLSILGSSYSFYNGTHGMRHSYAQEQLSKGLSKAEVSAELGHVREEITNIYLR